MSAVLGRLGRLAERRQMRRWARAAEAAGQMPLSELEQVRARAGALRHRLDGLIHVADGRLALPRVDGAAVPRPLHADWTHRPPLWSGPVRPMGLARVGNGTELGPGAGLFHDCRMSELTFRQIRNTGADDLAPFGVQLDVFQFDGSFLSIVLDLPPEAVQGLERRHIIRLTLTVDLEAPLEIYARLNVRHGPNREQIVREFSMDAAEMTVEFDLAYTELNEKRVDAGWMDLIFEGPEMNQITIRDVTLSRRPRAAI